MQLGWGALIPSQLNIPAICDNFPAKITRTNTKSKNLSICYMLAKWTSVENILTNQEISNVTHMFFFKKFNHNFDQNSWHGRAQNL